MQPIKFTFGDIVVVEKDYIGVMVKNWLPIKGKKELSHEVYVRSWNGIKEYPNPNGSGRIRTYAD